MLTIVWSIDNLYIIKIVEKSCSINISSILNGIA